ncbi:MAG: 3-hydroxyacyl-CoA dehydrogenase [Desulfobacteraceae bacterium 4572_130]|nr:MAG: 3-hydroxyacyl-CoA dehydrogenase [Desulfobacteraceae bacterium 4572_130]
MEIKECTAVVTGGSSGLGKACVSKLVDLGAKVAVLDIVKEKDQKIESEFKDSIIFCKTNVADENSVQKAVEKTINTFGKINIVINCAGIGFPGKVVGKDSSRFFKEFNKTIQVNLVGTINVIRHSCEKMVNNMPNNDGEKGVVINTSSIAAFEGQIGQAAYSASKAGIVGMTLPIAREFAYYGIRVLTIAPGLFDTPILSRFSEKIKNSLAQNIPFPKRFGKPLEFAELAMHIIKNPILNGETIRLDSGLRMS